MRERIREYIELKGITAYRFAQTCGVQDNFFCHASGLSARTLAKIERAYPDLNIRWVITGEGDMLRDTTATDTIPLDEHIEVVLAKDAEIAHLRAEVDQLKKKVTSK